MTARKRAEAQRLAYHLGNCADARICDGCIGTIAAEIDAAERRGREEMRERAKKCAFKVGDDLMNHNPTNDNHQNSRGIGAGFAAMAIADLPVDAPKGDE